MIEVSETERLVGLFRIEALVDLCKAVMARKERPQNKYLKPFKPKGDKTMGGRLFVRVDEEIERAVRSRPDAPDWLRKVIADAVKGPPYQDVLVQLRDLLHQALQHQPIAQPTKQLLNQALTLVEQQLDTTGPSSG